MSEVPLQQPATTVEFDQFGRDASLEREFSDYKTSMITDEDPLRGLLFY